MLIFLKLCLSICGQTTTTSWPKKKKRTSFEPAKGLLLQSKYRSRDFPGSRCPVIVLVSKKRATGSRTMDSLVVQRLCYNLQRMYSVRRKKKVGKDLCEAICWLCVQGFSGMWILDELLIRTQHAMRPLSSFDLALFL